MRGIGRSQEPVPAGDAGAGRRSLANAAILVAAGFLLSRVLGVVRTAAIAHAFGTEPDLAAYWVAFRLPDLIFQLVAGATLASAFIPSFTQVLTHRGEDAAWRMASSIVNIVLLVTTAIAVIAFIFAPVLVPLLAPGLGQDSGREKELNDLAIELTRLMLLSPIFFSVGGMVMGILNARRHFVMPALAPVVYNLAIIAAALLLAGPFGVRGLAIGVVAGSALHLLVQLPALRSVGMRYTFAARWRDEGVAETFRLMVPRIVGLAAAQGNFFITTIFFASLVGDEAISALTYAWLLMMLPHGLFAMAISTAAFPEMAESAARNDHASLRALVGRNMRLILYLMIPAALGLILLGRPIIALALQRGEFDRDATVMTQGVLVFLAAGLFAYGPHEILSRGFYSLQDTRTPMVAGLLAVVLNIILSATLLGPMDERGPALAMTLASTVETAVLYTVLRRKLDGLDEDETLRAIGRSLAGAVPLVAIIVAFLFAFDLNQPSIETLALTVLTTALGGGAYLLTTAALRSEEASLLLQRAPSFLRR